MTTRPQKMVTLNVSGHLFTLPEADILKYPYSKLADVASCSLADDVASLNVPADAFAAITHYLSTKTLPPLPHPATLESTFKYLGIPYPSLLATDHHTASIGASGSIREWEARLPASTASPSSQRREALRIIERGLLTGRPEPPSPPLDVEVSDELPSYSDIRPRTDKVAGKYDLIPAILRSLAPNGMTRVVLIPSDVYSLAVIERPSWDMGTGANDEEEVLSFPEIHRERKRVLRLPTGGGYTCDRVFGGEFKSGLKEDLSEVLEREYEKKKKEGIDYDALESPVVVWVEDEMVLKNVSPMGLYETRSGRALVVQIWK